MFMTYITKMRLKGFKSFANPTELEFKNNYNVIIGPNGSGKSNIMDGLSFVLGTISAKSMRAEKSSNLIFNGAKKGAPMKEAEVSIAFDNSKNEFPIKTPEIVISRVIRQNGNSIYKINEETRTRTEVIELLNHAQIDADGYNIVLQGDIVRFMEMKPDERKELIEQVSGITVFEDKKHKAMLELTHVDEKLNEANIILTERKTYLRELKKERDQALKYRDLEKNIKSNKATNLHLQTKSKEEERDEVDSRLKRNNDDLEKIDSKIKAVHDKIAEGKKNLDLINKDIEEKGEIESVKIHKDIESLRSEFIKKSERLNTCNSETKKIAERIKQLNITLDDTDNNISELKKSEKELDDRLKKLEDSNSKLEEKLKKFKTDHGVFDSSDIDSLEKQTDETQKSIFKLQEDRNKLLQRKFHVDSEIKSIGESLKASTSSEYKKLKDSYDSSQDGLAKFIAEESVITSQLNKARRDINEKNTELFKLHGKSASAREFLSSDMALKKIIDSKMKGVHGTISQLAKVDSKYALALEVCAGPRLKGIVVEDEKVAADCIKILKASKLGTCIFLPLNKIKKSDSRPVQGTIANALEVISYDKKFYNAFSYVFGGTFIVEDVESARKIGVGSARMVTLEGDLFESSGAIIGGHRKLSKGISLVEKDSDEKLEKLESEVKDLARLIETLENRYADVSNGLQDARKLKSSLEGEIIRLEKSTGLADAEKLKKRLSELEGDKVFSDLKSLESDISAKTSKLDSLRKDKERLRSNLKDFRNPEVASSLNELEGKKQRAVEEILQLKTDLKNIETQITNIYNPEKQRTLDIIKQHERELNDFTSEAKALEKEIKGKESDLKDSTDKEAKFQKDYKGLFEKRNKVNDDIRNLEASISIENVRIKDIENKINNASISRAKVIAELEALLAEFEQFKGIPLRKSVTQEELKVEIRNFEKLMVEMGNVNLKALEVYETIEKEYEGLVAKAATLETEKADVLNMIAEIEKKKKGLFMKTYRVINENFQRIFVSLSTKGEAFLELENKEDPLSAGIEIKVRIAGNKYLDIKSLSGGEKTLAALAFIFSIQEHQPSSFYLLDEVDAALDKTNSHLLSTLVAKYSKGAQYVLISHNDMVISEADQIYGVSMQENGISKVISLKI